LRHRTDIEAASILEIGTFDGNTALNLAVNAKRKGHVTTVDLPTDSDGLLSYDVPLRCRNVTNLREVGVQYKGTRYEGNIRQVLCDSAKLDWEKLGPFDLVFIDGCHHYDYVKTDTANSMKRLNQQGLIVWHDYGMIRDVSRLVDETARTMRVFALRGGRLAVGLPGRVDDRLRILKTSPNGDLD
jgi:predicted O-methyltransferase YrrM